MSWKRRPKKDNNKFRIRVKEKQTGGTIHRETGKTLAGAWRRKEILKQDYSPRQHQIIVEKND